MPGIETVVTFVNVENKFSEYIFLKKILFTPPYKNQHNILNIYHLTNKYDENVFKHKIIKYVAGLLLKIKKNNI